MILHSKLRRRHTWPFELFEILVENGSEEGEEVQVSGNNNPPESANILHANNSPGSGGEDSTNNNKTNGGGNSINNECEDVILYHHHQEKNPPSHHTLEHLLKYKEPNDTSHLLPKKDFSPHLQQNGPDVCTCKSSNNKIGLLDATTVLCASVLSHSTNGTTSTTTAKTPLPARHSQDISQNSTTLPLTCGSSSSAWLGNNCRSQSIKHLHLDHQNSPNSTNNKTDDFNNSSTTPGSPLLPPPSASSVVSAGAGTLKEKKLSGSSGFQPIQDKFSFLSKKSRESRKRKQREKAVSPSTVVPPCSSPPSTINNNSRSSTPIQHKDYCPHSKRYDGSSNNVSPNRKSNLSSNSSSGGSSSVFRGPKSSSSSKSNCLKKTQQGVSGADRDQCFNSTSTSSNNNSPVHSSSSQNCSSGAGGSLVNSQGGISLTSSQLLHHHLSNNNKSSSIGSGASASGSGLKGSVVTANIINCNSHHETEGKIPSANGTATGALSLQVNMANGEVKKTITLWQNYYPEGQWGWIVVFCALIVQAINHGVQLAFSTLLLNIQKKFHVKEPALLGLLGSTSMGISLFFSPVWISFCKTKSTRLSGVFGGLVASLGCLFTSFASQFHQLFFSYGIFIGVGVGLSRDSSTLMVGQYFKRKREMVEIIVVAASGIGISFMSVTLHTAISTISWRLGLQAVTGAILLTFFLGTCYRSASLYHPQRRAILHLKNQKKKVKVKDISKREEKPPFLDFSCLKSKTLQILLLSSAFTSFGINSPLIYLSLECSEAELDDVSFLLLHTYVGVAWVLGCCFFGLVAVQKNQECRVSKQYLCQVASVICGISIIALTVVKGYNGLVVFTWVYGFSLGGYNYSLKVYTYERVRARHFPRAWSFVQSSQAIPIFISTPLVGYMDASRRSGYYMSAAAAFIGSLCLFLTDVRRRRLSRRKANNSSMKTCSTSEATQSPKMRRLSFAFPVEPMSPHVQSKHDSGEGHGSCGDPALLSKELTCISEEGLAEIDFQDMYFDDWAEYLGGDCITSCNKVENCLASEYDPDFSLLLDRRTRRWSRNSIPFPGMGTASTGGGVTGNMSSHSHLLPINNPSEQGTLFGETTLRVPPPTIREIPVFRNHPWVANRTSHAQRSITVIDEASV